MAVPQPKQQAAKVDVVDDLELFPMPKRLTGGEEWKAVADRLNRGPAAPKEPPPSTIPPSKPTEPPSLSAEPTSIGHKKDFKNDEEREKAAASMFKEYLSSADKKEAQLCAEEICSDGAPLGKILVQIGMQQIFDCVSERDHTMMTDLLVWFLAEEVLVAEAFVEGLASVTSQLDDLAIDVPKSPELCGRLIGKAIALGRCSIDILPTLCGKILSAEIR